MHDLCQRTLCFYRKGIPLIGETCHFCWTGRVPCTGKCLCIKCGRERPPVHCPQCATETGVAIPAICPHVRVA